MFVSLLLHHLLWWRHLCTEFCHLLSVSLGKISGWRSRVETLDKSPVFSCRPPPKIGHLALSPAICGRGILSSHSLVLSIIIFKSEQITLLKKAAEKVSPCVCLPFVYYWWGGFKLYIFIILWYYLFNNLFLFLSIQKLSSHCKFSVCSSDINGSNHYLSLLEIFFPVLLMISFDVQNIVSKFLFNQI